MSEQDVCATLQRLAAKATAPATPLPEEILWPSDDPLLTQFLYSFLLWEGGARHAQVAAARLQEALVDVNDLRVCTPSELAGLLPSRYPRAQERCERLLTALDAIYQLENRVHLTHLAEMTKRDARAWLDALPGIPRFVVSRVALLALDAHAFPLDERLVRWLRKQKVSLDGTGADDIAARLERRIRAGDARAIYLAIESLSGERDGAAASSSSSRAKES